MRDGLTNFKKNGFRIFYNLTDFNRENLNRTAEHPTKRLFGRQPAPRRVVRQRDVNDGC